MKWFCAALIVLICSTTVDAKCKYTHCTAPDPEKVERDRQSVEKTKKDNEETRLFMENNRKSTNYWRYKNGYTGISPHPMQDDIDQLRREVEELRNKVE